MPRLDSLPFMEHHPHQFVSLNLSLNWLSGQFLLGRPLPGRKPIDVHYDDGAFEYDECSFGEFHHFALGAVVVGDGFGVGEGKFFAVGDCVSVL